MLGLLLDSSLPTSTLQSMKEVLEFYYKNGDWVVRDAVITCASCLEVAGGQSCDVSMVATGLVVASLADEDSTIRATALKGAAQTQNRRRSQNKSPHACYMRATVSSTTY